MNDSTQPAVNPSPPPSPTVINLGTGGNKPVNLPGRNWFNSKLLLVLGGFLVLLVGLGIGTFLVQRPQSQNPQSKAASSCQPIGWLQNPTPAVGATNVSTTPDFSWTFENGKWGQVGDWINLYVWNCPAKDSSCQTIFHTKFETSGPVYSMSWAELGKATPLDCNKTYYWYAYLSDSCIGPMTQAVNWNFTTGCPPQQTVACDNLAVSPNSGTPPLDVSATLTGHTTNGGSIASYKFDFGDGTTPVTQTTGTLAHTYSTAGTYTVKGTVTDDKGNTAGGSGACQQTVTVTANQAAVCDSLTLTPSSGNAPLNAVATVSGHTTNGGSIVNYKFDFGDGTSPVTQTSPTLAHTFASAGNFTVKGYVIDDKNNTDGGSGNCQTTATVTVQGTAACQMVSADKDLTKVNIGDVVTFSGWGVTSDTTEQIDQVRFIVSTSSGVLLDKTVAASRDSSKDSSFGGIAWKGTQAFTIPMAATYSVQILVHWVSQNRWLP